MLIVTNKYRKEINLNVKVLLMKLFLKISTLLFDLHLHYNKFRVIAPNNPYSHVMI